VRVLQGTPVSHFPLFFFFFFFFLSFLLRSFFWFLSFFCDEYCIYSAGNGFSLEKEEGREGERDWFYYSFV